MNLLCGLVGLSVDLTHYLSIINAKVQSCISGKTKYADGKKKNYAQHCFTDISVNCINK